MSLNNKNDNIALKYIINGYRFDETSQLSTGTSTLPKSPSVKKLPLSSDEAQEKVYVRVEEGVDGE